MKQFPLAKYIDFEDLCKAKSEYYQALCERLLQHLVNIEDVRFGDEYGGWYWTVDGERVDVGL